MITVPVGTTLPIESSPAPCDYGGCNAEARSRGVVPHNALNGDVLISRFHFCAEHDVEGWRDIEDYLPDEPNWPPAGSTR
jgi:hypothetical protein